jgi:hypothetical protein
MPIARINSVFVTIEGVAQGGREFSQLCRTLELMPAEHLRHVPTITVGDRPRRGGGGSAPPCEPGGPYIRLNRTIFNPDERPINTGAFSYTLLHECGHIVDWAYACMVTMQREDPPGYQALLSHAHNGATQGPGEHYADAYADYFFIPPASRAQGRRARTGPVDARMQAVLNSTAMRQVFDSLIGSLAAPDAVAP